MTPPVNRLGAMRGPNGSTLDDVTAVLGQIRDQLTSYDTRLAAIQVATEQSAFDLRRLIGETVPSLWAGLPEAIGSSRGVGLGGGNIGFNVIAIYENILSVLTLGNFLLQQLETLNDNFGSRIVPGSNDPNPLIETVRLVALDLERVQRVLGLVENPPIGTTIKDLMRSIDTNVVDIEACVCGNGGGGDPTVRPPPGLCSTDIIGVQQLRVAAWERLNPGGNVGTWGAVWPIANLPPIVELVNDNTPLYDWYGMGSSTQAIDVCYSWDFTGVSTPIVLNRMNGTLSSWGPSNSIVPFTGSIPIGSFTTNIPPTSATNFVVRFDDPNVTPPLNAFLTIGQVAS